VSSTRDAARDARTTTVKTVPRCGSRSVVRPGLFNARSVGEKSAAVQQWITDMKLSLATLVKTWHDVTGFMFTYVQKIFYGPLPGRGGGDRPLPH